MRRLAAATLLGTLCWACSLRQIVAESIGDSLSSGGGGLAEEGDFELARDSAPFALKTLEALHKESPRHRGILTALASGFTQYAYAFVQQEADRLEESSVARAREQRDRAKRLYLRARGYGLKGLEVRLPSFEADLRPSAEGALEQTTAADVPLLYWTAAAWAASVAADKSDVAAVGELPLVEALMKRALELDEAFGQGSIHEFFVAYDGGRSEAMGGSEKRAREHLERALALSQGQKVGAYVTWAETVCVQKQDRKCFDEHLDRALGFEVEKSPQNRLANVVAQRRAKWLKTRVRDLFLMED